MKMKQGETAFTIFIYKIGLGNDLGKDIDFEGVRQRTYRTETELISDYSWQNKSVYVCVCSWHRTEPLVL